MSEEIKPVFVDIDGVVNSSRSCFVKIGSSEHSAVVSELVELTGPLPYGPAFALRTVDPVCVALINKIFADIREAGGHGMFVLSSTHRKHFHNGNFGSKDHYLHLRAYLTAMGFQVPARFSITEALHVPRGQEVKKWIEDAEAKGFSVNDYVILDDGSDFEQGQPLVRVDPTIGLSFENYADAVKYLALPAPGLILV